MMYRHGLLIKAKWKAAEQYCADRKYEFKIMTEDDLGISHDRRRY